MDILTPDQRLRVFVSSTLHELALERTAVKEAIDSLRLAPVLFELGARPHPPRNLYRAYIEQSHIRLSEQLSAEMGETFERAHKEGQALKVVEGIELIAANVPAPA